MIETEKYYCFVCNELLSERNSSLEHVILNSCGGKLKSTKLLCKGCNSQIGTKADSELSEQLNFFSTFINVDRDRGETQKVKGLISKDGEDYTLTPGEVNKPILTRPKVDKELDGNKTEIKITASDMATIDKIFKDLKKKYPQFDIVEAKTRLQDSKGYMSDSLKFTSKIGGDLAFRSIVKTGIEFYILSGGDSKFIKSLVPYITGKQDKQIVWFSHFENPYALESKEISHFLHVKADSKEKIAFAYVDFFNAYTFFICLNDKYEGVDFENTYCYDLINKKKLNKRFIPKLNREDILKLSSKYQPSRHEFMIAQNRIQRTFGIADEKQASSELSRIIKQSLETTIKRLVNPNKFTEDIMKQYIDESIRNFMPFYIHRNKLQNE